MVSTMIAQQHLVLIDPVILFMENQVHQPIRRNQQPIDGRRWAIESMQQSLILNLWSQICGTGLAGEFATFVLRIGMDMNVVQGQF